MAIINNKIKALKNDRDENIFIGMDLPFRKSDGTVGYFESTTTTFTSVRNNIKSLLMTTKGERIMQPSLGLNLRKYLFQQINDDTTILIENDIYDALKFWLPFVEIVDIIITSAEESDIGRNSFKIDVKFSISRSNNYFDTVNVTIT